MNATHCVHPHELDRDIQLTQMVSRLSACKYREECLILKKTSQRKVTERHFLRSDNSTVLQ